MSVIEIEDKLIEIVNKENQIDFLYELLSVYNIPKATITRLKSGDQNLTKRTGEVHLKNRVWFKNTNERNLLDTFVEVEEQVMNLAAPPRYIIVTNFTNLLAKDTKTQDAMDIEFKDLPKYFDFFLAWKGIEKINFDKENPADIKAAERFARIYDTVKKENTDVDANKTFDTFFMRLLFCMFAEDTDIFKRGSFTNAIKTLTKPDGSDLNDFFTELFIVLDKENRKEIPNYFSDFPYVNGQLFSNKHENLIFSSKSRRLIIECGEYLNWTKINPDIFGSMVQAIATNDNRSLLGTHYTSVPNILKVIKPLFLDELNESFEKAYNNVDKLDQLYERIGTIKFFDPACGSGNFLIITYKELRRLEIKILLRKRELTENLMYLPSVTLDQFYGIEIEEFSHDIAKLSLWIAEHQMNMELEEIFGDKVRSTLPLQSVGDIRCANALQIEWSQVCSFREDEEVYIFGNPPYIGAKKQKQQHKKDLELLFQHVKGYKMLDYITAWFYLGSRYIANTKAKLAFVSTNSITHGEQVSILWPTLLDQDIEIDFAYNNFTWSNNAKNNAGVTVVIIGLRNKNILKKKKELYTDNSLQLVENITPYLSPGKNILVYSSRESISNLPKLNFGSMPNDGGYLILSKGEYHEFINEHPNAIKFLRKFVGSDEFINDDYRYCLWINPTDLDEAMQYKFIENRVKSVRAKRLESRRVSTNRLADRPYSFGEVRHQELPSIVVPAVSSQNRFYIPMGVSDTNTILSNRVYAIYGADIYILGVLMSRMHMTWVKAVGGRLRRDYNYSAGLCYNTFPFPEISTRRKNEIKEAIINILDLREEFGESLSELYNPNTMPSKLKDAHEKLDLIVDKVYQKRNLENDAERLALLLEMYHEMTER